MARPVPCTRCYRRFGGHETWLRHFVPRTGQERCRTRLQLTDAGFKEDSYGTWHRAVNEDQLSLLSDSVGPQTVPTPPRALARVSDPETSHAAARAVSYRTGTQKARLLAAYLDAPEGLTDDEAGMRAGLPQAWKRCSDLRSDGVIEPTGVKDGPHGTPVMVCRAVVQEAAS